MTTAWRNLILFGAAALAAMAMIEPSFAEEAAAAAGAAAPAVKAPDLVVNKADD